MDPHQRKCTKPTNQKDPNEKTRKPNPDHKTKPRPQNQTQTRKPNPDQKTKPIPENQTQTELGTWNLELGGSMPSLGYHVTNILPDK